jgi:hypothetical protein
MFLSETSYSPEALNPQKGEQHERDLHGLAARSGHLDGVSANRTK